MTIYYEPGVKPPVFVACPNSGRSAEESIFDMTDDGADEILIEGPFDEKFAEGVFRQLRSPGKIDQTMPQNAVALIDEQ